MLSRSCLRQQATGMELSCLPSVLMAAVVAGYCSWLASTPVGWWLRSSGHLNWLKATSLPGSLEIAAESDHLVGPSSSSSVIPTPGSKDYSMTRFAGSSSSTCNTTRTAASSTLAAAPSWSSSELESTSMSWKNWLTLAKLLPRYFAFVAEINFIITCCFIAQNYNLASVGRRKYLSPCSP